MQTASQVHPHARRDVRTFTPLSLDWTLVAPACHLLSPPPSTFWSLVVLACEPRPSTLPRVRASIQAHEPSHRAPSQAVGDKSRGSSLALNDKSSRSQSTLPAASNGQSATHAAAPAGNSSSAQPSGNGSTSQPARVVGYQTKPKEGQGREGHPPGGQYLGDFDA